MEYEKWERFYLEILNFFEYSQEEDERSAKILSNMFKEKDNDGTEVFNEIKASISEREVFIFGASPTLKKDLRRLFKRYNVKPPWAQPEKKPEEKPEEKPAEEEAKEEEAPAEEEAKEEEAPAEEEKPEEEPEPLEPKFPQDLGMPGTWIAADAATETLMEMGLLPHIIVTDLDGGVEKQLEAAAAGTIIVVHAHGDNIKAIEDYVPKFEGKIMGTTQGSPFGLTNVQNFGGFTDGDRAVFIADEFSASKINLVAFNFREPARKGEDRDEEVDEAEEMKAKKLSWASVLIAMLENKNITYLDER